MSVVLKVENVSKQYRLGTVGSGTLRDDMTRFWAKLRGKEDPTLKVGDVNDRTIKGSSDYVWALQDINFEVKQGEILGVIGKNGAGKSTLLKILSKVTAPTTGRIRAKGRIASLLEVGTGFHPELTGRENIYLNGAILGMTKAEIRAKLDEIVDFAGVEKYLDTPVKRYSSGMTVRLGFAVAAHLEPEILIVDEVLAVGDAEFQKKAIGKMQDVSKGEGRTVLFVSHNMTAIRNICNRCILIQNGKKHYEGNHIDTIDKYITLNFQNKLNSDNNFKRKGSGELNITKIGFFDKLNNQVEGGILGEYLEIRFFYQVNNKSIYNENLNLGVSFFRSNGDPYTFIHNRMSGIEIIVNSKNDHFKLIIPKVNFKPDRYYLKYGLMKNYGFDYVDSIDFFFELVVNEGDFYKSGEIVNNESRGVFFLDAVFK